jgi:AcrR family transcriptional regulator
MNTEKNNPKYRAIFEHGKSLFWKHGVSRITVEEICANAGVSKRTFYKHFSNKKKLAEAILKHIVEQNTQRFQTLAESDLSFAEKTRRMILLKFQSSEGISEEFISDIFQNKNLGLHAYIEKQSQKSKNIFAKLINEARSKGEIRENVSTVFVMTFLDKMREILEDKDVMSHYQDPHELIVESIEFLFYGLGIKQS